MLARSGVEPVPEHGWWGNPCGASLPPPPQHHHCGCRNYTGDGGPLLDDVSRFHRPRVRLRPPDGLVDIERRNMWRRDVNESSTEGQTLMWNMTNGTGTGQSEVAATVSR
jgi:hypothetical protein